MKFGTFCSGIGAPEMAWSPLGFEPQWFSEIDPFASAVLAHHYPGVPNLGDMERIRGEELRGTVDVVCAGTPCQSFSVAGLRGGMADPRGNLALIFLGLVDAIRPRWVVWENVPGVLSSSGGRDFGAFLGGLAELRYGWAYRVLDAQHFRVPQRRRRVFVVGCLGDWRGAAAVLFERHSLCGHPAPSRETGEGIAGSIACGLGDGGETARALTSSRTATGRLDPNESTFVTQTLTSNGDAHSGFRDERGLVPVAFSWQQGGSHPTRPPTMNVSEKSPTLSHNQTPAVAYCVSSANSCEVESHARPTNVARCLDQTGGFAPQQGGTVVAFQERGRDGGRSCETQEDIAYSLNAPSGGGRSQENNVAAGMAVRRLTPRECERLQGFPDDYTLIPYRGKKAADGPRYRAMGNSMAVPVLRWIGRRIMEVAL